MTYDIVRFKKDGGRKRLILSGVTIDQAREWCSNEHTKKEGVYFDGFQQSGEFKKHTPKYSHYFVPSELV